jgi:pSer/pThr/pTyr-binding forkhead associated (FHA) protein
MFALKVSFRDGSTASEMVFVRRSFFVVGADKEAHVVVEDMHSLGFDLAVAREVGGSFTCRAVNLSTSAHPAAHELGNEKTFTDKAELDLEVLRIQILALDTDLCVKEGETLEQAGVRVLHRSCAFGSPYFPALAVIGKASSFVFSFARDQAISVGRARSNIIRLDSLEVSSQHARVGYDEENFWIEDLGSTNGTFLNSQQVAGRVPLPTASPAVIARNTTLIGIMSEEQLNQRHTTSEVAHVAEERVSFPIVISTSEVARPAKLVLLPGESYKIGRDPSSDMWLGAPHVSRLHCEVSFGLNGEVTITDSSTNGTLYREGVLRNADSIVTSSEARVFGFGGAISIAVCFNEEQERIFTESRGSLYAFSPSKPVSGSGARQGTVFPNARPAQTFVTGDSGDAGMNYGGSALQSKESGVLASLRSAGTPLIVLATLSLIFVLFLILSLLKGVFV